MRHDPLNDAISTLHNAEQAGKGNCILTPSSKLLGRILKVMADHQYIQEFEYTPRVGGDAYEVRLHGAINRCGIIKPRFSVKREDLERFEARYLPAQDFGVLVLTTTAGVISHHKAKELGIGGRLLAYVY